MRCRSLLAVFSLMVYLTTISECQSFTVCRPCRGLECNNEPDNLCEFGETRNYCGFRVCKKGPNAICGGPWAIKGVCGDGLSCYRNRCDGCYLDTFDGVPRCSEDKVQWKKLTKKKTSFGTWLIRLWRISIFLVMRTLENVR